MPTSTRMIPPNKIPCIASPKDDSTPRMDNQKLILPDDLTCQQLLQVLRKRINMNSNQAIFVFCENKVVNGTRTVKELFLSQTEHNDGVLYVIYSLENAFG